MTARDYAAERYNRRTRAIERQAAAAERIASALELSALAAATTAGVHPTHPTRTWKTEHLSRLLNRLTSRAEAM
jgi:hypothetical protein